jgi:hypothetical protein
MTSSGLPFTLSKAFTSFKSFDFDFDFARKKIGC